MSHFENNPLFRANALNHLNSPEEIHTLFQITKPALWVVVLSILIMIGGSIIWLIAGRLSIDINAKGIILPENSQVISILGLQPGLVTEVYVHPGSLVHKGDLLAEVNNPYANENLNYLKTTHQENLQLLNDFKKQYTEKIMQLTKQFEKEEHLLQEKLKHVQAKSIFLKDLLNKKEQLFKKHYLTIPELEHAKEEYLDAVDAAEKIFLELNNASFKLNQEKEALKEKMNFYEKKYLDSQHELEIKLLDKRNGEKIISMADGKIMNSNISKGDYVAVGKTLLTLLTNSSDKNTDALIFVNHAEGKKIFSGMDVYVLPTTMSAYEYGYIRGKIISISEYPASKESVNAYFGNMNLVDEFFASGVPLVAKVRLMTSDKTVSGFVWTTKKGAPFKIEFGTAVVVKIVTKEVSPLGLLI